MQHFTVQPYGLEDLQKIAELEKQCFEHPWSYDSFCMEYADHNKFYFVAKNQEGELLGYGGYAHIVDEAHVMNIAVRESARGKGVGTSIVAKIIGDARERGIIAITLEVDDSNTVAIALYEKLGFRCAGLRPHYYGWDRPARIYWLTL